CSTWCCGASPAAAPRPERGRHGGPRVRASRAVGDERRRDDERAASLADDDAARARWLMARLRAGDLELERVHVAARVGDPAAALALGRAAPHPLGELTYAPGTAGWPSTAWCAAALGAARLTLDLLDADAAAWG